MQNNRQNSSLREKVLEQQVVELQRQAAMLHHAHLMTLTTLVWYLGGEVTLSADDYTSAKGVLLTEQVDVLAKTKTYRTRKVGEDGGGELAQGGLLPPTLGATS